MQRLTDEQVIEIWRHRAAGKSLRNVADAMGLTVPLIQRLLEHRTYTDVEVPEELKIMAETVNAIQRKRHNDRMSEEDIGRMVMMRREGATQQEIADAIGVTQACVSMWLKKIREGG